MTNPSTESQSESGSDDKGISNDQLPEDLQPDDNPLAEGLEPGETAGDLFEDGKDAEQSPDDSDED